MSLPVSIDSDWLPIVVCGLAAGWDLYKREIPDALSVVLVLATCTKVIGTDNTVWWNHLIGGLLGLLMGMLVGQRDRFGGGDVKLFASLTMWFGLFAIVPLALWIALAGLPLSLLALMRKQRDLAYAPAILAGVCLHVWQPDLLHRIAGLQM
ncbi:MAG: A24 family peptidase [Planctomycetota bacterium]